MNLLVTGAGGRIGRRLVEKLTDTPHTVRALARTNKPNLLQADEFVLENLSVQSDFELLLEDIDMLIHLADGFNAYEHLPVDHQSEQAERCLQTLERLAKTAAQKQIRIIYLSTIKTLCGTYSNDVLTEATEPDPQSQRWLGLFTQSEQVL